MNATEIRQRQQNALAKLEHPLELARQAIYKGLTDAGMDRIEVEYEEAQFRRIFRFKAKCTYSVDRCTELHGFLFDVGMDEVMSGEILCRLACEILCRRAYTLAMIAKYKHEEREAKANGKYTKIGVL